MLTRLKLKSGEGNLVSAKTNPLPRRVREPSPRALEASSIISSFILGYSVFVNIVITRCKNNSENSA